MESSKGRILVVDDNVRNIAILQKTLSRAYRVAAATSGEEALQVASRFTPDVMLLDIMMPGIDGYETCRRFRAAPELTHTKIIMVSAKALVSERLAGYEAGADDYIVKPFDEDELQAKVRVYLRLRRVEEVNRLKTDILMLLGHETRTPLTTILSPIELVLDDETLSKESRRLLQMAQDGARRLNEYLDRLIFLSSLHAGLIKFDLRRQDLADAARDAVAALRPAAAAAGVELVERFPEPVATAYDTDHIRRVIFALLDNALRVSPRPGRIEVELAVADGYACLSVTDHGPGVAEHFLPRVFDGLAVEDTDRHTRGQGLSLVTARAILRCHEGVLNALNAEGGGAVFTLKLPLDRTPEESRADRPPADTTGARER